MEPLQKIADHLSDSSLRQSLNGEWSLTAFPARAPVTESLDSSPAPTPQTVRERADGLRVPALVPGNVELDLSLAGHLPADLYLGENILQVQRFEGHEWWYEREFPTPAWHVEELPTKLIFEGLDCFATIWVNEREVGRADNALIPHRFDITAALHASPAAANRLTVRLESPLAAALAAQRNQPTGMGGIDAGCFVTAQYHMESLRVRKPAHAYGWDIMPRALSAGIWRDVFLEPRLPLAIEDVFIDTRRIHADSSEAVLQADVSIRADRLTPSEIAAGQLFVRVSGVCGGSTFCGEQPLSFTHASFPIPVVAPRLWWPLGYGEAALYETRVELLLCGEVVATRRLQVGIRTVALDRTAGHHPPHEPGRFGLIVNGTPVFCRGSNWVPLDVFHSRDASRLDRALALFGEMECNIVRCWGGSVYESDAFFDACDRAGLLVWQDFALACAGYPQDAGFLDAMRREAVAVVRRLRGHASLALWCGDNECDMAALYYGRREPGVDRITREVFPEVLRRHDPLRPYLPSSPCMDAAAAREADPEAAVPEQHLWGPRGYFKAPFYAENNAVFASEIGYHGCPGVDSVSRFITPESRWPALGNAEWNLHSTEPVAEQPQQRRVELMHNQIRALFGSVPGDLAAFALASQITQAEAKKFFVELFRQRKAGGASSATLPASAQVGTTGIIWWNMLDGWPQFSDAIVDYYYEKKLAFHYLKRAHAALALVVAEPLPEARVLELRAVNDTLRPRSGRVRVWDADSGAEVFAGPFQVPANGNAACGSFPRPAPGEQRVYLFTWEVDDDQGEHQGERAVGTPGHAPRYGCGHYLHGQPPFDFCRYVRNWLPKIAALDHSFAPETVAL